MLKKISLMTVLLISLLLTSCASANKNISNKTNERKFISDAYANIDSKILNLTFVEAIEESNCIAVAEFISSKKADDYIESQFKVKEVLRGEITEEIINVSEYELPFSDEPLYNVGDDYMLLMIKYDMIFYDYPGYVLTAFTYIPMNDVAKSTMYGEKIPDITKTEDIISLIRESKELENSVRGTKYIKTEDISAENIITTIVAESDFILKVKIIGQIDEGIYNANPYYCEVIEVLKGAYPATDDDGNIIITLLKGSVEVGEMYIVMVNSSSETAIIYVQSSKESVIPISDTEKINEVIDLIADQRVYYYYDVQTNTANILVYTDYYLIGTESMGSDLYIMPIEAGSLNKG